MKLFEKIKIGKEREIRFLGFPILQYGKRNIPNGTEKYIKLFPKSFEHKALDKILKFIPKEKNHDHVWIVRTEGLGETQILNFMIDELHERYHVKNPCIVSQREIYKELFELYTDIPFYKLNIKQVEYGTYLKHKNINYKGKCFHIYHCTNDESMAWLKSHQNGDDSHLLVAIKQWWKIDTFSNNKMCFSKEVINSTLKKVKEIELDLNKFVFIAPEANGAIKLSNEFWLKLSSQLQKKGYDVFVNTVNSSSLLGKTADLSIAEAVYLASLAQDIVALRCGFAELLAFIPNLKSIKILYTQYREMPSYRFKKIYSLKQYPAPNKKNIKE